MRSTLLALGLALASLAPPAAAQKSSRPAASGGESGAADTADSTALKAPAVDSTTLPAPQTANAPHSVEAQKSGEWGQWGLGALALMLGAGGLATGLQAKKAAQQAHEVARQAASKASQTQIGLDKVKQSAEQPHAAEQRQQAVERGFAEVAQRLQALEAARAETARHVYPEHVASGAVPAPVHTAAPFPHAAPAMQASATERVGEAFRAWCVGGGSLMNRYNQFQNDLHGRGMHAGVAEAYRDAGAMSLTFSQTPPANAVPYWLVMLDHEVFLLPEPTNAGSFKEADDRCFEVRQPAPGSLQRVVPARVAMQGDSSFSITERGFLA